MKHTIHPPAKSSFAVHKGEFFVQLRATGIPTVAFYTDRFRFRRFPKDRHIYLTLDDAIAWQQNEVAHSKRPQRWLKALALLREARDRLTAELQAEESLAELAKARAEMRDA